MTGNYEHHIDQDAKVQDAKKAINHLSKDASRRVIFENSVFYEDPLTLRPKKDFQPPPWAEVAAKAKVQDNDSRTRIASDAIKSMHKRPEALVSGAHLDRVLKWAQGDKRIEKPDGSVWYRAPVDWLDNGADADFVLRTEPYDLVILDLALPRLDGHEVLKRLRARSNRTPVMVLSANNTLSSRVNELDHGADDYVAKPFDVEELEARIRVLLRRSLQVANPMIGCGDLLYDTNAREFTLGGKPLTLTPRERAVLETLAMKLGTTVSKAALAQSVFPLDTGVSADAIEIYVHRVRKKLEGSDATIVTLRGLGYLLRTVHHGS